MLSPKQEAFAQAIADGMTGADAYRTAYDAGKMKDSSIHVNASKLLADAKVAQRVDELKSKLAKKALWTREMSIKALVKAYQIANQSNNASGMTGAIKELNSMHGFDAPQKHIIDNRALKPVQDDDWL